MKTIVVGGGLAGLRVAKKLGATLITDAKEFVFLPRLPDAIHKGEEFAVRNVSDVHNDVVFGRVTRVDADKQYVLVGKKKYSYDMLVLATGASALLPVPGATTYAIPFYGLDDVRALNKQLPAERIIVVGGGPTGVEVAAEIAQKGSVTILHADSQILAPFPERARSYATQELSRLGVTVKTEELVERITAKQVVTKNGSFPYDVVVWCAGVKTDLPSGLTSEKGYVVNEFLQVQGHENVFACGDCAQSGAPLTAQAAVQEADVVVKNIRALHKGKQLAPNTYHHKGNMLSLGRRAVVTVGSTNIGIAGLLASKVRHLYYWWQLRWY